MRTVLAVDGGNSKTDVALVEETGRLVAAVRGPTTSHQAVGLEPGLDRLADLVARVASLAGSDRRPDLAVYSVAGADTPADVRRLEAGLATRGFADRQLIRNDAFGALRAGTDRGWGVVVICGSGVNAAGIGPDGRFARLVALGDISGDWGGGNDVGWAGLAAAVRGRDGRGAPTRLSSVVPGHFGLTTPTALTRAMYTGRIDASRRIGELSPVVFAAASDGDAVARAIVDRLADEVVAMASAMLTRLHLRRLGTEVVLAGGVFRTLDAGFRERIMTGIAAIAPAARVVALSAPPVAGAALVGLDELLEPAEDPERVRIRADVRRDLQAWDETTQVFASDRS